MSGWAVPFDGDWLQSSVRLSVPIALAALGENIAERTGMLNIGLEGFMLSGAFGAVLGGHYFGGAPFGLVAGALAGMLLAALGAFFMINLRADQVVIGVGLVLVGQGATSFLFRRYLGAQTAAVGPLLPIRIPLLADIPFFGGALFDQNIVVYLGYGLAVGVVIMINRTGWGLIIRAAGQAPRALDASGHSVAATRWFGMLAAGALAGLGGAYLSVGQLGSFNENMSSGRGYIALAAVVFGGWRIGRILIACLLFGGVNALQLRLQAIGGTTDAVWGVILGIVVLAVAYAVWRRQVQTPWGFGVSIAAAAAAIWLVIAAPSVSLPAQVYTALPYICALVVLAGYGRTNAAPKELAIPYDKASR
jgi:simple sugar transport system permease protein